MAPKSTLARDNFQSAPVKLIPFQHLSENTDNPRRTMGDVTDLAASIKTQGLLQPLGVRPDPEIKGHFRVIWGNRRYRAIEEIFMGEDDEARERVRLVPCAILDVEDDEAAYVLAVTENIARNDLTAEERSVAVKRLADRHGWSAREIARRIGMHYSTVSEYLNNERDPVLAPLIHEGQLSATAAIALRRTEEPVREELIERARSGIPLTLRDIREAATEPLVRVEVQPAPVADTGLAGIGQATAAVLRSLENLLVRYPDAYVGALNEGRLRKLLSEAEAWLGRNKKTPPDLSEGVGKR